MKFNSKLVALGALGAASLGAAAYGVARAIRRRDVTSDVDTRFDSSDLDEPVIITEEVIVISDAAPFEAERL